MAAATDRAPLQEKKWQTDLEIFSQTNSVLVIEGNIFDRFLSDRGFTSLDEYLYSFLQRRGYEALGFYDPVIKGFYCPLEQNNPVSLAGFARAAGILGKDGGPAPAEAGAGSGPAPGQGGCQGAPTAPATHPACMIRDDDGNCSIQCSFRGMNPQAHHYVRRALRQTGIPAAAIISFASHLAVSSDRLTPEESDAFLSLLKSGLESLSARSGASGQVLRNILILLVNRVNDLPVWFCHGNPTVKIIRIDSPSREERGRFIDQFFKAFFTPEIFSRDLPYYRSHPDELRKIRNKFIGKTEGFTYIELNALRNISLIRKLGISELPAAVDYYRFGVAENPWEAPDLRDRIRSSNLSQRVKGQGRALRKTMEVVKRAVTGLSGLQHSSAGSKPRGVLFFAGPTGTGKTETAKALSEMIFMDERNCIRFDMSEFMQPQSDQRLFGAPPGYVGYESGGELTNAVREHPFSILLFDEIEKAHSSILDKFLQILEDGRMTDGQGKTVYFSECIIIFTSNLGIYEDDPRDPTGRTRRPRVKPDMSFSEVEASVRSGVEHYFKQKLERPEILNRIGENIVVFDFIRPEAAREIVRSQTGKIATRLLTDRGIRLEISPAVFETLCSLSLTNLDNGGRGIGNIIESCFLNPLSGYIFDNDIGHDGTTVTVSELKQDENGWSVICQNSTASDPQGEPPEQGPGGNDGEGRHPSGTTTETAAPGNGYQDQGRGQNMDSYGNSGGNDNHTEGRPVTVPEESTGEKKQYSQQESTFGTTGSQVTGNSAQVTNPEAVQIRNSQVTGNTDEGARSNQPHPEQSRCNENCTPGDQENDRERSSGKSEINFEDLFEECLKM